MKLSILQGNVRNNSNTALVVDQFIEAIETMGVEVDRIVIKDLEIHHCSACWTCQNVHDKPGCPKLDDMDLIYNSVLRSDGLIFASPIYSWYCTPPLKSVMDRLVYGLNKYYGEIEGESLWEGKPLGLITTCGYDIEGGAGVFEEGLRRYAKHSKLNYIGKLAIQDLDGKDQFRSTNSKILINDYAIKVADLLKY